MALEPDEYGTVFSGCAWRDLERMRFFFSIQLQRDAINGRSMPKTRTPKGLQCPWTVAERWKSAADFDHIKGDNRDPKVFYHKESAAYIMTLFLCCPAN